MAATDMLKLAARGCSSLTHALLPLIDVSEWSIGPRSMAAYSSRQASDGHHGSVVPHEGEKLHS